MKLSSWLSKLKKVDIEKDLYSKKIENFRAFWKDNLDSKERIVIGEKPK